MVEIHNILCATDFSATSALALDHAVYFARCCGAQLHCIHVIDESCRYWVGFDIEAVPPPPPKDPSDVAGKRLDDFIEGRVPGDVTVVHAILHGGPFVEIVRYARDKQIGLIVLGTHGRTGLSHILMGSVAEKVVRKSPCPVLTVRQPENDPETP